MVLLISLEYFAAMWTVFPSSKDMASIKKSSTSLLIRALKTREMTKKIHKKTSGVFDYNHMIIVVRTWISNLMRRYATKDVAPQVRCQSTFECRRSSSMPTFSVVRIAGGVLQDPPLRHCLHSSPWRPGQIPFSFLSQKVTVGVFLTFVNGHIYPLIIAQ